MSEVTKTTRAQKEVSNRWLVVGFGYFAIFLVITAFVIFNIGLGSDARLALFINNLSVGSTLNSILVFASKYGREYFWIPVVALMLLFGKRETKMLAIELAVLFVVGIVAGEVMKYAMYRARPYETLTGIITRVPLDTDSSYPSGHALIVSIGAIFSLVKFRRKNIAVLLALEAAIVCYSRVYVGMHYPLDVFSGILLGGFIVFTGAFILERYLKRLLNGLTDFAQKLLRGGLVSL